ncbi:Zinc finger protein 283 [Anthophora plagiata]
MLEKRARNVGEREETLFLHDKPNAAKVGESTEFGYNVEQPYRSDTYVDVLEPRYVCLDCGKKYKWQDSLRRHQRVDCGNKEKKFSYAYSTLQLSYGFPSGFQHYAHSMNFPQQVETKYHPRNDGISANICFGCGKRYKWRDSLLRHQRVECGNKEKKFCCKLCPKKFYHQYKLNEHYQGRHKLPKLR